MNKHNKIGEVVDVSPGVMKVRMPDGALSFESYTDKKEAQRQADRVVKDADGNLDRS